MAEIKIVKTEKINATYSKDFIEVTSYDDGSMTACSFHYGPGDKVTCSYMDYETLKILKSALVNMKDTAE